MLVRRAGRAHARRQGVELLVFGVAQNQAVVGIPQDEGFRDILDRVLEAQFCFLVEPVGELLGGDVDDDADEMRRFLFGRMRKLGTGPEPHPVAVDMAHAEFMVEDRLLAGEKGFNHFFELRVFRMDAVGNVAEIQKFTGLF